MIQGINNESFDMELDCFLLKRNLYLYSHSNGHCPIYLNETSLYTRILMVTVLLDTYLLNLDP